MPLPPQPEKESICCMGPNQLVQHQPICLMMAHLRDLFMSLPSSSVWPVATVLSERSLPAKSTCSHMHSIQLDNAQKARLCLVVRHNNSPAVHQTLTRHSLPYTVLPSACICCTARVTMQCDLLLPAAHEQCDKLFEDRCRRHLPAATDLGLWLHMHSGTAKAHLHSLQCWPQLDLQCHAATRA